MTWKIFDEKMNEDEKKRSLDVIAPSLSRLNLANEKKDE